jgi:hypothetical protein
MRESHFLGYNDGAVTTNSPFNVSSVMCHWFNHVPALLPARKIQLLKRHYLSKGSGEF